MGNNKCLICDGKIGKEEFQEDTLMFLLKESNISDGAEQDEDFFWFSEVAKAKSNNKYYNYSNKQAESKYFNLINGICRELEFNVFNCSYVNLNPEGGGVIQSKDFFSKSKKYSSYTKSKIEELSPKAIICCGTYKNLIDLLSEVGIAVYRKDDDGAIAKIGIKDIFIIRGKHPTDSHEKNTAAIERIKNTYDKLKKHQ